VKLGEERPRGTAFIPSIGQDRTSKIHPEQARGAENWFLRLQEREIESKGARSADEAEEIDMHPGTAGRCGGGKIGRLVSQGEARAEITDKTGPIYGKTQ